VNEDTVQKLLAGLGKYLPNYRQRPGQQEMALAVAKAITEQKNLVVEGGTGIGKSMAYLVPALLSVVEAGGRVLVATSHKPLQDQIAKKDIPLIAKLFRAAGYTPFNWVTLKGISNYICWHSEENERVRIAQDPVAVKVLRHAATAGPDFSGDFEELPFNVPSETRSLLSAESEDCLGSRCPQRERCYALRVRKQAERAEVVVTNHSLLSLDIRNDGAVIPGDFSNYIIDEGHNFEDNATKANGLFVSLGACRRFINSEVVRNALKINSHKLDEARENLSRLQQSISALWSEEILAENGTQTTNEDENKIILKNELPAGRALADNFKELLALVKQYLPRTEEDAARVQRVMKQGAALQDKLEKVSAVSDTNMVYFVERIYYFAAPVQRTLPGEQRRKIEGAASYSLNALPVDVSGYLYKWFQDNTVVVTSATLSDGQSFEFFKRRVGMRQADTLIVPSPFDYPDRVRLFLPKAPTTANGVYANLASQIAMLLNAARDGRVLVLFTSYAALDYVWRKLSDPRYKSTRPMFRQGDAQMQRIIADFQNSANGVIFGTRSWWQGVDLPGMSMVIMDKLPFPQLNDPIIKARIEEIDTNGGSSFVEYMLPTAIITFRQGFGRLMRQENDRGVVVICDERVVKQRYGMRFIRGLPPVTALQSIEEVEEFLAAY